MVNVNTENYLSGLSDVRIYVKVRVKDLGLRIGFGTVIIANYSIITVLLVVRFTRICTSAPVSYTHLTLPTILRV